MFPNKASRILVALMAWLGAMPAAWAERPAAELIHIVRQDCGSCHGLTLQGGLGPALTEAALRNRPPEYLSSTILHGHPGTPMPPFRGILDEADAKWIATQLLAGFPREP